MAPKKPPPVPKSLLHDDYMDNELYDGERRKMAVDIDEEMDEDEIDQLIIAAQSRSNSRKAKAPVAVPLKARKFVKALGIPVSGARFIPKPREVVAYDEPEVFDDIAEVEPVVKRTLVGRSVIVTSRDDLPPLPPLRKRLSLAQPIRQSSIGLRLQRPSFKKNPFQNNRFNAGRGGRGLGRSGLGGNRPGGNRPKGKLSAEELDRELDSYMKGSSGTNKSKKNVSADDLDQDLEGYMQGGSGSGKHPRVNVA